MSDQDIINIAKGPYQAYNKKDWNAVRNTVTPDFDHMEAGTQRRFKGPDQTIEAWKGWAAALPDSACSFDNALVSGNKVVMEITWRGKHTGPLQTPKGPIPATGKSIQVPACLISEIEGGKVKASRHYFDMMTLLTQLGVAG